MTVAEYKNRIREIAANTHFSDIYTSPDFQCDQTDGFPTSLCVCWEKGVAWLELNTSLCEDDEDITPYEQMCADFGIRSCGSVEEYNSMLQELGRDAVESATLYPDESEEQSLC